MLLAATFSVSGIVPEVDLEVHVAAFRWVLTPRVTLISGTVAEMPPVARRRHA